MRHTAADYRWTTPKMLDFLRHLSGSGSVASAARQVGMSRQSAYNLRARMNAFAQMWDQAVALARQVRVAQDDIWAAR